MESETTITLYRNGCEFDVNVAADVEQGGSNQYGSDEPEWTVIENRQYTNPKTNKPISERLQTWIETNWLDYVDESLMDAM